MYGILITIPIIIITTILLLSIRNITQEAAGILSIITLFVLPIIAFYVNKFILNKIIFKKYKRIIVNTEFQSISKKLTILFVLIARVATSIPSFGFMKVTNLLFDNSILSLILGLIICIFIEYCTINLFLEKYITVSEKNEE